MQFHSLEIQERTVVLLEIEPASHRPVSFKGQEFVRVGSYKKRLREHPEKERDLWGIFDRSSFELGMAMLGLDGGEVLELLDYPLYFGMLKLSIPDGKKEMQLQLSIRSESAVEIRIASSLVRFPDLQERRAVQERTRQYPDRVSALLLHGSFRRENNDEQAENRLC